MKSILQILSRSAGIAGLALAFTAIAAAPAMGQARLHATVTVSGDVVTLGDLMGEVGEAGDTIITRAPAPGRRLVLNATRVAALAKRNGVKVVQPSARSKIVVTRDSRLIDSGEIKDAIRKAFAHEGIDQRHKIDLSSGGREIHVPVDLIDAIRVTDAQFDRRSGRFSVKVGLSDGSNRRLRLTGRIHEMIEVPVVSRPIRPGERITKGDIEWASVAATRIRRNIVTDASFLIGRTPKRPLRSFTPIGANDVRAPVVVAKGEVVTLRLRHRNMVLQAKLKAMENGAQGQAIRLMNPRSKRIVEGVVVAPGRVALPGAEPMPRKTAWRTER